MSPGAPDLTAELLSGLDDLDRPPPPPSRSAMLRRRLPPVLTARGREGRWRRDRARRVLAALLVAVAAGVVVEQIRPHPAPVGDLVVVAARDVTAGTRLADGDVRLERRPVGQHPVTALTTTADVVGRVAAGTVDAGEVWTPGRLAGPGLLAGTTGRVAVAVPLPTDPGTVGVVAGGTVDLLATGTGAVLADHALVLSLPRTGGDDALGGGPTWSVVLAVTPAQAGAVAGALGATSGGPPLLVVHGP
ncbi:SAF domain-containing protein [Lapillicoccus jejuensis]|uniref:SAF domain-containing protein n=1 Tax=Lapillicoccus jejuensis TaxID=402171 RepID=A0A542E1D4_9MICO|nr:SAF domain-containing protein [Lapillicoccus jejuensis]